MAVCLRLFYAERLGNHIHYTFIFFCSFLSGIFAHNLNTNSFQTFIWLINETLKGTTTLGQSGSQSNGNEGVLHTPSTPELKPYHQMKFSLIPRIPTIFWGRESPYYSTRDVVSIF